MPASGMDPVASALRVNFNGNNVSELNNGINASVRHVLSSRIEYEPATNYQSTVLKELKCKYVVINTKTCATNVKTVNGVNGVNIKKSNTCLPVPKSILFPLEQVQLGYHGSVAVGSGMVNLGNTCYLNSTLQALFHVPAFVNWLLSDSAHYKCEQNADYQVHPEDITCAVIKTFKCSQHKTGVSMKPQCIYNKLKAICKHLSHGSQEDAHEFMRYLLESLEKSFLNKVQGHSLDNWSKETTPVNQIFGGYIRTEVVCLQCRAVSTTFQHFQDLPLDIRKYSTLNDALSGYFDRERLPEGEDAYKCDNCHRKVPATKKFSIERPPNVLSVQLKRFSMNGKLTKQVQLPQHLDLTRFVSASVQPRQPVKYRLVSMVTHMGQSANCGHYTAIALAANGSYYQFDDASVRQIPLATVLNMSAYLVLYELERPFPPVHSQRPSATATLNSAHKESQSASVGGADSAAKSGSSSSPPAGSPAPAPKDMPRPSPSLTPRPLMVRSTNHAAASRPATTQRPAASPAPPASLVPYESDVDSDSENKDGDGAGSSGWMVTADKPRPSVPIATTASWRVTDVQQPKCADAAGGDAKSPSSGHSNGGNASVARTDSSSDPRRNTVVPQLMLNSHRGYGNSNVRSWNGTQSTLEREVEKERHENRKRSYSDAYNEELDRGRMPKKRSVEVANNYNKNRCNPFQRQANRQNAWRNNQQYQHYRPHQDFNRFNNKKRWNNKHNHRNMYFNNRY